MPRGHVARVEVAQVAQVVLPYRPLRAAHCQLCFTYCCRQPPSRVTLHYISSASLPHRRPPSSPFLSSPVSSSLRLAAMQLETVSEMCRAVFLYTVFVTIGLYILLGLSASVLHARRLSRALLVTLISALVGLATAAALGSIPALLIAALYAALPFSMPFFHAVLWGCGQGLLIAMLNAGLFHRIL